MSCLTYCMIYGYAFLIHIFKGRAVPKTIRENLPSEPQLKIVK